VGPCAGIRTARRDPGGVRLERLRLPEAPVDLRVPTGRARDGFIVALWHLPLFFTPGQPQHEFEFVPFLLTLIVVRFLFGWVCNGSGGSILL
jgi:hypothetical protein